ncbi:MAG: FKBP-type peptidyl-prolyl cis-trans isomerase [Sphingorhabdus sp.]
MKISSRLITALTAAAMVAGCSSPQTGEVAVSSKPVPDEGKQAACANKTASGLGYTILKAGKGASPTMRDGVTVSYRGTLPTTGEVFDANEKANFPVAGVVAGFGEGLQLMQPGGRIRLCIPAALAYGESAAGSIPPNSDLEFEVDLLSVQPGPAERLAAIAERKCDQRTASGLGYQKLRAGKGASPSDDDTVRVGYAGYFLSDGELFDSSNASAFPVARVIKGFGEGVMLMNRGAKYRLCIPSRLGYGDKDKGPIPANSNLIFVVELLEF